MTESPARTESPAPAAPALCTAPAACPEERPAGAAGRALRAVPDRPGRSSTPHPELRLVPAPGSLPPYDDGDGPPVRLRLVRSPDGTPAVTGHGPGDAHHDVAAPPGPPDARPFAHALVQRLLEVRGGVRPVLQLRRDTTPTLFADLEHELVRRPRPSGARPTGRDLCSVHVQQRDGGVAEVCATVRRGDRMAALALRLEAFDGQWVCTQVQGL